MHSPMENPCMWLSTMSLIGGFVADTACKQTAEAYFPAVQNLIGKAD